jgi:glycosyltransferase involved in cell wall biosynthesis
VSDGSAGPHSERVTVVLDAQPLTSVAADGGIGSYTRHLLDALATRDDLDLHALCLDGALLPEGVQPIPIRRVAHRPRLEAREHAFRVRYDLRRHRPADSVFHNPSYHAPAGVAAPWVQTLLDVIPLVIDTPDQAVLRARWKRFGPRYRNASAVIAISRHAADEGIRLLGLEARKVHVAPLGVDRTFVAGSGPTDPPYLLTVGHYSRRKGFAEAFAVMDALADAGYPHRLVVAGRIHPWARAELSALHRAARHPERIALHDAVPDLVPLYQGATAFVMTSRYEGFGLTALEAMACGVPVVAFANSSVSEVVGQGGQLVDDGDVMAMTMAVRTVLDDPSCASEWRERALAQARLFSWTTCAAQHAQVYHAVTE